jgi:putative tryptophan/tyrosine transport system substrate-binding protein
VFEGQPVRRRDFITLVGGAAAGWPLAARAQQAGTMRLVGVLMDYAASDPAAQSLFTAFRDTLAQLGWKEGSNLRIEVRWSAGSAYKVRAFAKELVDLRPDAILGRGTPESIALSHETRTIPMVFAAVSDPIGTGFAANLTHPGGNMTGFTNVESTVGGKWVELIKEIAPRTTHVALLFNPGTAAPTQFYLPSIQAAAQSLDIRVTNAPIHAKDEIEVAIAALARDPGGGLIVLPDTFNLTNRDLIIPLAIRYGVPAVSNNPIYAESGALITYGVDFTELFRQAAGYIDRILKGAVPADLPVQNPTKFELVINLKTAKALGLKVPQSLSASADHAIE